VHTVNEMTAKADLAAARDILAAFARSLPARP
jgi:putative aminopeptidase FrvX